MRDISSTELSIEQTCLDYYIYVLGNGHFGIDLLFCAYVGKLFQLPECNVFCSSAAFVINAAVLNTHSCWLMMIEMEMQSL